MRTKDDLFALGDISTLLQYLYMNKDHRITYSNGLTNLCIRMDENFNVLCKNLSFPDLPESDFSSKMTPSYTLGVIDILQETQAEEFPERFKNRWEEIRQITLTNLSINVRYK